MLHKNQRLLIRQLQQKKFRQEKQCFIVEGKKSIQEFLDADYQLELLFYTDKLWRQSENILPHRRFQITASELESISNFKNPDEGIAIFRIPTPKPLLHTGLIVALDDVRDPGNLGTIIRLCDWFGVAQIVCSTHSVDCYNPKVVQASMGSLTRVSVVYTDLASYLSRTHLPTYAATLSGKNIYKTTLPHNAILVLGNEANGISKEIISLCQNKITIPQHKDAQTESLNVAMASAILLSEFCRDKM